MASSVAVKGQGAARVIRELAKLDGVRITAGIPEAVGSQAAAGGKTLAEIAAIHEFGAEWDDANGERRQIPERSWLRGYFDANEQKLVRQVRAVGEAAVRDPRDGATERAATLLGMSVVGGIKQRIIGGIAPPNAPSTVAAKGSSTPLVDTSQMLGAINYQVESGRKG